jgi:small conductance mechanosensitive channel
MIHQNIISKYIQHFNNSYLENILQTSEFLIVRCIIILLFLFLGQFLIKRFNGLSNTYFVKYISDEILLQFMIEIIHRSFYIIYGCIFLRLIGVSSATLLTILGTVGFGIIVSLKDSLSNLAAGIIMVTVIKPFKIGDYVTINNIDGTVVEINLFSTKLNTIEKNIIHITNSQILENTIINFTESGIVRTTIKLGVNYNTNIVKLKELIKKILEADTRIIQKETINLKGSFMNIASYENSSIIVAIKFYTTRSEKWPVYYSILEKIKELVDKKEINIPFPQFDISIKNIDSKNIGF